METIGEKIRRIRKSKGISQKAVSDTCGITQPSYANIESSKTQNITIEIGKGIAKALDISFNELFEIEGIESKSQELQKQLNEKDAIIQLLENKLEKEIQVNKLLQQQYKQYFKRDAGHELKENFGFMWECAILIANASTEEAREKTIAMQQVNYEQIKWIIDNILETGLFSKVEALELLYENDNMVNHLYETKQDTFIDELTKYYNNFIKVSPEELSQFITKFTPKFSKNGTDMPNIKHH